MRRKTRCRVLPTGSVPDMLARLLQVMLEAHSMSNRYRFLDERKFRYFCEGLTLDATDMEVLDGTLQGLDQYNKLPSQIIQHSQHHGFGPGLQARGSQIIVTLEKRGKGDGNTVPIAMAGEHHEIQGLPPALHIMLRSPTLDILQRVEIPLRYVLKGLPSIEGTHMVYLHVLQMDGGQGRVYYGVTKRGWMRRFAEHMKGAMRDDSPLLLHRTLREGIRGRLHQLYGRRPEDTGPAPAQVMQANHHVVCVAGVAEEQALLTEEYLVGKYSFGKVEGLNMIPGGKAGVAYLHELGGARAPASARSEDREHVLEQYLREHPRKGLPNPKVAQLWQDDEYAARIICAGPGRLTHEQVLEIRAAATSGMSPTRIGEIVGARNPAQVERVLAGVTYTRVR